jgi:outer membrane lipoprotein-sorting protein
VAAFGQNSTLAGDEIAAARRDAALHPLLDLERVYPRMTVKKETPGGEEEYVLELTPETGKPVVLHVSARTSLVLSRESGGETSTYTDHRNVDGEIVPFRVAVTDSLGDSVVEVKSVAFNVPIPDAAFAAARR